MRHTHTYSTLQVSRVAFYEIKEKLEDAGYHDQIHPAMGGEAPAVDMQGIAIQPIEVEQRQSQPLICAFDTNGDGDCHICCPHGGCRNMMVQAIADATWKRHSNVHSFKDAIAEVLANWPRVPGANHDLSTDPGETPHRNSSDDPSPFEEGLD